VRYQLSGLLDGDEELFRPVSEWSQFRRYALPGTLVSRSRIVERLTSLLPELVTRQPVPVTLSRAIRWELEAYDGAVPPELAAQLGKVISTDMLERLERGTAEEREEGKELRDLLKTIKFLNQDGEPQAADNLLLGAGPHATVDESLRSQFAPSTHRLSVEYDEEGMRFFASCRTKLAINAVALAQWIRDASGPHLQAATLQYLLNGKLRQEVFSLLNQYRTGETWLDMESLENSEAFQRLSSAKQKYLLAALSLEELETRSKLTKTPRRLSPEKILTNIALWWRGGAADEHIPLYEKSYYPAGRPPRISRDALLTELDARREWVVLFLVGIMHSMGRSKPEAHRNFIRMCEQRGWLDVFANPEATANQWIEIIDTYTEEQIDDSRFLHWLREYVSVRAVSRHLDDYVELFLSIQRFNQPFGMDEILKARASPTFQGGGIDAPPIHRFLGYGACYIVRELMRMGVINNPHAYPHCYVPVLRVRKLVAEIGHTDIDVESGSKLDKSRKIFQFLKQHLGDEEATFDRSFDLPLLTIANDQELQRKFLDHTLEIEDDDDEI